MKALRKIYLGGGMVPIMNVLTDKSTPKRIRNSIIERINKKELHTIKEVAGNFLHNNIPDSQRLGTSLQVQESNKKVCKGCKGS